jgi:FixJ family two-component response regulator
MNGKVMVEWLEAIYPNLKILFTSGYPGDTIAKYGVLEAGVEFLSKPYTLTTLARKVREMLDQSLDRNLAPGTTPFPGSESRKEVA